METVAIDLTQEDSPLALYHEVKNRGYVVDILVNDAGVGQHGYFVEVDWNKYLEIIHLNILALTKLTHLYAKDMVSRNQGKILQLGSISGFQPGPLMAVYHASKAFVVSLSEAMATELEDMDSDVTITCLCPGPTETAFFVKADMLDTNVYQNKEKTLMQPEEVAEGAYKALMEGERIYISGVVLMLPI